MFKIVLDPGHGEWENRGVIPGYYEGTQMFLLVEYLKQDMLKYKDVAVHTTRATLQDNPDLTVRGGMVYAPDLFLSIHSNATGVNSVNGSEIYDSILVPNRKLADSLGQRISLEMGTAYRGTKYRINDNGTNTDWYGVIRSAVSNDAACAMLVEHGFHTNILDCQFLLSDMNLRRLALAEARIIADHFGLQLDVPVINPKIYRIQVGAYSILDNAQAMQAKLIDAGFPAIIKES